MAVAKSARRQGVGKAILAKAIEEAKARNETEMILEVIEQNPPAIELYKQVGFQIQHRLLGFEMMLPDPNAVNQPTLIGKAEKTPKKKQANRLKECTFSDIAGALRKRGPLATSWSMAPASVEQFAGPSRPVKLRRRFRCHRSIRRRNRRRPRNRIRKRAIERRDQIMAICNGKRISRKEAVHPRILPGTGI